MAQITVNTDALKANREFKRFYIQPGKNVYRILPPFGDVDQHNNYPYKKWTLAWMLDPATNRTRPFAIPYVEKNGDPISKFVKALEDFTANIKKELAAAGVPEEKIKENLAPLAEIAWKMKPKTAYYYNAANKSGEVGILELKSTAHKDMKTAMMDYIRDYAQDPTSLNGFDDDSGVWFVIDRVGEKFSKDTKYSVARNQIRVKLSSGKLQIEDDRAPLPESLVQNYDKFGYDLCNLYQEKTIAELQTILDYNIKVLSIDNPLLKKVAPQSVVSSPVVTTTETVTQQTAAVKPQGKKPIVLAMELTEEEIPEEDEVPVEVPPAQESAAPSTQPTSVDLDEMDSLLALLK